MYKKCGRHGIDAESINNEEPFATQFFNFMRKHLDIDISQVSVPQINLDIRTGFTPKSADSTPNHLKYPVDDINEPTPCTLLCVKGRTLRTIEVVDAILMATLIMHGRSIPSECALVEVTMIREGCVFGDLDYPDEEEGIEKLKGAKGNFILWPRRAIILTTHSSPIVLLQNREMMVLHLLKIPYATLLGLLIHLKILHKLPLLPKNSLST
jgi:hypothetical protein